MTLDQLKVLVTIVETGSLRKAAKALFRTQPTLTYAIKNLEEELNLKIFSRDHYRNTLTTSGNALYVKAKSILKEAREFEQLGAQLALGEEPEIRLAIEAGIPIAPLLKVLKPFQEEHPHTKIDLSTEYLWGAMERLRRGDVDLAILPWGDNIHDLDSIPFLKMNRIFVAESNFPPLLKYSEIPQTVLEEYVQVIVRDSSHQKDSKNYGVLENGRQWKVNDGYTKKAIILEGMGWGSMPEHLIEDELKSKKLVPLTITNFPTNIEIQTRVARQAGQPRGPIAEELWRRFREKFHIQ